MNESFDSDVPKLTARVKAGGCAAKLGSAELQFILAKVPVMFTKFQKILQSLRL